MTITKLWASIKRMVTPTPELFIHVQCPKHGEHTHLIVSKYEKFWCQFCFLDSLGPSLPIIEKPLEKKHD
jgi:hypothetical protein